MPIKSIVMAFVLSGWLIAAVVAFMIVAYASFFGVAVLGVVVWFVSARVDQERDGAVGAAVTPGFLAAVQGTRGHVARRAAGVSQ